MKLAVEYEMPPGTPHDQFEVDEGEWVVFGHPHADALVAAIAGTGPGWTAITLGDRSLRGTSAAQRHTAQLCVAGCRLDPLPTLRVADVVMLGLRAPQPAVWQAVVGTRGARAMSADDEAQVRALAGRVGLAPWIDRTAVDLPPEIEALTDVARALAGLPRALVLRRPEWISETALADLRTVVAEEQRRSGFSVLEVTSPAAGPVRPGSLPPP